MANAKTEGNRYRYATVDTAPGADGFWCSTISQHDVTANNLYFSVRGSGTATVSIQFKCPGDTAWTDYMEYPTTTRKLMKDAGRAVWRAGVKQADYTSGSITFGFDWD